MFLFLLIFACFTVDASIQIPPTFTIDPPAFETDQTIFTVQGANEGIANVLRTIQPGKSFTYYLFNNQDHLEAIAKAVHSNHKRKVIFEIYDSENILIGIAEEIWGSNALIKNISNQTAIELIAPSRKLIAKAKFAPDTLTIAANEQELASAMRQNDTRIHNLRWSGVLDPRLFLIITCLAIDAPHYHKGLNIQQE